MDQVDWRAYAKLWSGLRTSSICSAEMCFPEKDAKYIVINILYCKIDLDMNAPVLRPKVRYIILQQMR